MCISARPMDRKSRIMLVLGCSLLAIANTLRSLAHLPTSIAKDSIDFASGFILGISIVLNLWVVIRMRHRGTDRA